MISLTLPLPPVENHLYATVNGRRVKSKAAREYATTVWIAAGRDGGWLAAATALELEIRLFLKHDRDVSGNKCLQDALASAFGFNDKVIRRLVVTKTTDKANPRAEVTLRALDERGV